MERSFRKYQLIDPAAVADKTDFVEFENMAMRPAAGLAKRSEASEPFGKKKLGRNVEMFIAREDQLHNAVQHVKASDHLKGRAVWEDRQGKRGMINQRSRTDKKIQEEMELANRELLAVRSERIRHYYSKCYMEWEHELNARGLAIVRERD